MNSWAPLWSKVVDSSLWCEPDHVVKVFLTMLAKKDADHVVRGSAFNISQWAKKTEAETIEALKVLSSPDSRRLEPQPFDGRRIEKTSEGWLVLNGKYYQDLMRRANRLAYQADWQSNYRMRKKGNKSKPTPAERSEKIAVKREIRREKLEEMDADQKVALLGSSVPDPEWVHPTAVPEPPSATA